MNNKLTVKIVLIILVAANLFGCASIAKNFPKDVKDRPFQERDFDSTLWIEGDARTRGEMLKDLQWNPVKPDKLSLRGRNQVEILKILGEPDTKTSGKCCGVPRTREVEVWLYGVETKYESSTEIKKSHFQIYFTEDGKVDEFRTAEWNEKNPDYFPRVG